MTYSGMTRAEVESALHHHELQMLRSLQLSNRAAAVTEGAKHAAISTALRNILADAEDEPVPLRLSARAMGGLGIPKRDPLPEDEKYATDAPVWYSAEQADAWAAGYNTARRL